ncbi:MAG: hypothetical protein KGN77_05200 [Xanthomonadaceae bacterium]|nr:hypothetical protein [Xanthomonadaceae bacterium]
MSADPHLDLLKKIDQQVVDQGNDLKEVRRALSDGRVTFAEHAARLTAVEKEQAGMPERMRSTMREVLAEERETARHQRSRERTEAYDTTAEQQPVGSSSGLTKAIKVGVQTVAAWGPVIRIALLAGIFAGGCIASYLLASRQGAQPPSNIGAHP